MIWYTDAVCNVFSSDLISLSSDPAEITSPVEGAAELTDREILAGNASISYTCEGEGFPAPTLTWYFNGEPISPDSGVIVNGNQLSISDPTVNNSGIYQCLLTNNFAMITTTVFRLWILEVRDPRE